MIRHLLAFARKQPLRPRDKLLLYTDGVTDAIDPSRRRFGEARLRRAIRAAGPGSASELAAAISTAVTTFTAGTEPADDITLLVIGLRHRVYLQRKARELQRAVEEFQKQGGLEDLTQVARQAGELLKGAG